MRKQFVVQPFIRNRLYFVTVIVVFFILLHKILSLHGGLKHNNGDVASTEKQPVKSQPRLPCEPFDFNHVQEHLQELKQDDPKLIQYVKIRYLTPPSKRPYSLTGNTKTPNYKDRYGTWVADFFNNKTNGIFIEAGANEGEKLSHTLYLERKLGWTGLLIECNPTVVPYLIAHHRKAWVAGTCLAPTRTPGVLQFSSPVQWSYSGSFGQPWTLPVKSDWNSFEVQTLPLYTILAALGWTEVDFFCFDVEGAELSVLQTLPFDKITFKVLVVEIQFYSDEEKKQLANLLKNNKYHYAKREAYDDFYVHDSVKHLLKNEAN